jgi:predicted alpha/beta hydrolase
MTTPAGASQTLERRIEFARTRDGWSIALHRYQTAEAEPSPVILCPGYACNRHFLDFDDRYSLARHLARRGFDAWVVELRGRGQSQPEEDRAAAAGWTFDDFVRFDVPAAIEHVRERCHGRRPVWVGHSLGGMVIYGALGCGPELTEQVSGVVTMASPVGFPPVASVLARALGRLLLGLPFPHLLPQQRVLVALWSLIGWSAGAARVGMNPINTDRHAFGRALPRFIGNVQRAELQQLVHWSMTGEFCSTDGTIDYRAGLRRIVTPALIVAGAVDQLASPEMVSFAYDHIRSSDKTYREFAARNGDADDYGHIDLIFGRRAPEEVFPAIAAWIERVTGAEVRP